MSVKIYTCASCGANHPKWSGKCDVCGEWNSISLEIVGDKSAFGFKTKSIGMIDPFNFDEKDLSTATRYNTGFNELDLVLGGGLVVGSVALVGGDPGIGKSTLLLQLASKLAINNHKVIYASGEESGSQISLRAERLGITANPNLDVLISNNLLEILNTTKFLNGKVLIIDSIQTMQVADVGALPGTVSQVKACAHELVSFAKTNNISVVIIGHVTKDGQIAGPKLLEHMVDTVLYFEGERSYLFRLLRSVKNRFGNVNEIGVFNMESGGLVEVPNPSALFLSTKNTNVNGTAIFAGIEGSRPIFVEIQALVAPSANNMNPRRAVVGWDSNRLAMILAVLATRCNLNLSTKEIYLNVVGGIKIDDPAADLAVAAALISSATASPLPFNSVIFGEIGLSGEIRRVTYSDIRIKEAVKLGFVKAVTPKLQTTNQNINLFQIEYLNELLSNTQS